MQKLNINREEFDNVCKHKFFFGPSSELYGGTAGLYDYGPVLCAMKNNLLQKWREHFVLEENICEIESPCAVQEDVFIHSGHVKKFNDLMCKDLETGECFRADHHLENFFDELIRKEPENRDLEKLKINICSMTVEEMVDVIKKYNIKSPKKNNMSDPFNFGLMFQSSIGAPDKKRKTYFRPELAQSIFMNFKRIHDTGYAKNIPFAISCIGQAFRNEISPQSSLLRVREFTLAEIEHFINPNDKTHSKYDEIEDVVISYTSREMQNLGQSCYQQNSIRKLVNSKIIGNQTTAYFIGRTQLFLEDLGIKYTRFRQHQKNEMAHYAHDCWDAECLTSYGWVECVGVADRSCYDLSCHMKGSQCDLRLEEKLDEPIVCGKLTCQLNKKIAGPSLKNNFHHVEHHLKDHNIVDIMKAINTPPHSFDLITDKGEFVLPREYFIINDELETITHRKYIPNVIESSYGIGRILYACLEQNFWMREDGIGKRNVFSIVPKLAYRQVAIISVITKPEYEHLIRKLEKECKKNNISCYVDNSKVAIGKKYARCDELGIPFAITCDEKTLSDHCATIRDRDSTEQIRIPLEEITNKIKDLCN